MLLGLRTTCCIASAMMILLPQVCKKGDPQLHHLLAAVIYTTFRPVLA